MRKKVLFLIESLGGGGAEKVLVTLLKHLDRNRFDPALCCVSDTGAYRDTAYSLCEYHAILPDPEGLRGLDDLLYRIRYKLIYKWLPARWVYRLYIPKGADIEIAFLEGNTARILSASANKAAKKYAWIHIDLEASPWTQQKNVFKDVREEKQCYDSFDQIVCVSESVKSSFLKRFNPVPPVSVCYNPIDSQEILRLSREKPHLPSKERFRIITIGRLAYQKGFDRLIRIAGRLVREGFDFDLWILGEGPLWDALHSVARKEHLEDNVTFWGFRKNPYPYLAESDLFVCSSHAEGYSTAATEALLLGLPVVTTDCAGMRELFGREACGMITANDEERLYEGIKAVLSDSALLDSCRQAARRRGADFKIEKQMVPIEELLAS